MTMMVMERMMTMITYRMHRYLSFRVLEVICIKEKKIYARNISTKRLSLPVLRGI